MPDRVIFPEFREEFGGTRYPFADTATLLTRQTSLDIGIGTFVDASLYPIGGASRLYLASITVNAREVTLALSDDDRASLATATFDPLDPPALLTFTDGHGRPAGIIVANPDEARRFSAWPVGTHTFNLGATEFVASCVIPTPEPGVRGILTSLNELLAGDVWLVGDNGVVVRENEGRIRIDIVGDPLFVRKLCGRVDLFDAPNLVRTINGCPPDAYGNWNLTVGDHMNEQTIVRIYPSDDGLVIAAVGQSVRQK